MAERKHRPLPQFYPEHYAAFWARVDTSGGPLACWPWTGHCNKAGYGLFSFRDARQGIGRTDFLASRVSIYVTTGKDPLDMNALHECDNPPCCHPWHVYSGTTTDNIRDKVKRSRSPKGSKNPMAVLTEDQVREIRKMAALRSMPQTEIAKLFGVGQIAVSMIHLRKNWAWLE